MAHKYSDLGETEVVYTTASHQDKHVAALEKRVDELVAANKLLEVKLATKPSAVTQEAYDDLCRRYQYEVNKSLPF